MADEPIFAKVKIEDIFGSDSIETKIMRAFVEVALFDSSEELRHACIEGLKTRYSGLIRAGYEKDGIMYAVGMVGNSMPKILELGPCKKPYGQKSRGFTIEK